MKNLTNSLNENAIREAAYYIWKNNGCPMNTSTQDWNDAIAQLSSLNTSSTSKKSSSSKSSSKSLASKVTGLVKKTAVKKASTSRKKTASK